MKKTFLVLILLSFLLAACAPAEIPSDEAAQQPEELVEEPPLIEEPVPEEEPLEEAVPAAEAPAPPAEKKLFPPKLTYPGSYNGPLYATSEQIGNYAKKDEYMANLKRNGVNYFIGMFGMLGKQKVGGLSSAASLGYAVDLAQRYPGMAVVFYGSGYGGEELDAYVRQDSAFWLSLYTDVLDTYAPITGEGFIQGFGEVETQEWSVRHNDPAILKLADMASRRKKSLMFHPVAEKMGDVEKLIEAYPDTTFLIHMFREDLENSKSQLIDIMKTHDNLFFSIDAAHIIHVDGNDILYSYDDRYGRNAKDRFVSAVASERSVLLASAVKAYKPLVDTVPDKVMWGTEAGPEYSFDPKVYDLLIEVSREFIAKVTSDKENQEALAYKNALRVFGEGAVLENTVAVASDWPECTDEDFDTCGENCGFDGGEDLKGEACENACFLERGCVDVLDDED